ncbi:hypothetical protein DdX_10783 [Ditylenchus destructor]|uniref:Uncharacterized protein n=1 Tax=Ditylenchus destructor TaxID=166010 RepID=A0AAD4N2A8_9BILA|nr:hypothetical protein DdX_10783 [Ditylenchus destructor]
MVYAGIACGVFEGLVLRRSALAIDLGLEGLNKTPTSDGKANVVLMLWEKFWKCCRTRKDEHDQNNGDDRWPYLDEQYAVLVGAVALLVRMEHGERKSSNGVPWSQVQIDEKEGKQNNRTEQLRKNKEYQSGMKHGIKIDLGVKFITVNELIWVYN